MVRLPTRPRDRHGQSSAHNAIVSPPGNADRGPVGFITTPAGSVPFRVVCHKSQDRDVLLSVALHDFDEETPQGRVLQIT